MSSDKVVSINGKSDKSGELNDFLAMLEKAEQGALVRAKDLLGVRRFDAAVQACTGEFLSSMEDLIRAMELGDRELIEDCQKHTLTLLDYITEAVGSKKIVPKGETHE